MNQSKQIKSKSKCKCGGAMYLLSSRYIVNHVGKDELLLRCKECGNTVRKS